MAKRETLKKGNKGKAPAKTGKAVVKEALKKAIKGADAMEAAQAPRPKDGSRKADVYDVYYADGYAAALKKADDLGLGPTTAKSWIYVWAKLSPVGERPPERERKAPSAPKAPREKIAKKDEKPPAVMTLKDFPAFPSERKARIWADHRTASTGMDKRAMIPHEIDGQWHVIPLHMGPGIPMTTFKEGDHVTNLGIRNSRAVIIGAGPEQSIIRYVKDVPGRHREPCISNRYLMLMPPPEGKDKKGKASRERL